MANNNNIEGLKGSWDYIRGENFDEFLKEIGINKILRTIAKSVKPRLVITEKNGKWSLTSESTFKTTSFEFIPEKEFDYQSPDGKELTMIIRFENGKWIQNGRYKDGKEMYVERWVNDQDQLQITMECGKAKASQLFKRVV